MLNESREAKEVIRVWPPFNSVCKHSIFDDYLLFDNVLWLQVEQMWTLQTWETASKD